MNIGVIDIETTGFMGAGGKIVEVGIAGLDTETGIVKECYHSLCREEGMTIKDRGAWIFENSCLTVEEIREAPFFDLIMPDIQHYLDSFDFVTAYNKRFDFDFLRSRKVSIGDEWPCPMIKATNICKIAKTGKGAHYGGFKWPNVEEAWSFFFPDEEYVELHRGLDDAMHEAKIVFELFKLGEME